MPSFTATVFCTYSQRDNLISIILTYKVETLVLVYISLTLFDTSQTAHLPAVSSNIHICYSAITRKRCFAMVFHWMTLMAITLALLSTSDDSALSQRGQAKRPGSMSTQLVGLAGLFRSFRHYSKWTYPIVWSQNVSSFSSSTFLVSQHYDVWKSGYSCWSRQTPDQFSPTGSN